MSVCVPLACRSAGLEMRPEVCSSGILCWCCRRDFVPKPGKGALGPTHLFLGQGSFLSCLPPGPGVFVLPG